jgi:hypothetical protein
MIETGIQGEFRPTSPEVLIVVVPLSRIKGLVVVFSVGSEVPGHGRSGNIRIRMKGCCHSSVAALYLRDPQPSFLGLIVFDTVFEHFKVFSHKSSFPVLILADMTGAQEGSYLKFASPFLVDVYPVLGMSRISRQASAQGFTFGDAHFIKHFIAWWIVRVAAKNTEDGQRYQHNSSQN